MDKMKIGKFIATCRKDKKITQEQLAEILGITSKSVSKWENGICLPDASLYEVLCNTFDITINELFEGCKINDGNLEKKAQENLLNMLKHKLYEMSDNKEITYEQFDTYLNHMSLTATMLKQFDCKEDAVEFLVKETNESYEICEQAYSFYIKLFD